MAAVQAVLLDVGGVLLLPDPDVVGAALDGAGVAHEPGRVHEAHYRAAAALEAAVVASPYAQQVPHYARAFVASLGVPEGDRAEALAALEPVWHDPAPTLWRTVVPGSVEGLTALAATGVRLAVVSNADGTIESQLRDHELCQVGEGPGAQMLTVIDSTVVGIAKPDPRIFEMALDAVDVEASAALYVGDTAAVDVAGAHAAGIAPVHFDPYAVCPDQTHPHVATLVEVADLVA